MTLQLSKPITRMKFAPPAFDNLFALGGRENDLQIWDLNQKKCIWKAKNVKHDTLSLRVPIWVTDLAYVNQDPNKIVVSSGLGKA